MRACWWVPFIRFALMQIIDGDLPTPITIHMLFYIGSSARWQPPPERWRRVLYLYAGVTIWARHLGGIGPGPRARAQPGRVPTLRAPGRPRGPFALRPRDPLDRPGQKWGAIFSQCKRRDRSSNCRTEPGASTERSGERAAGEILFFSFFITYYTLYTIPTLTHSSHPTHRIVAAFALPLS